MVQSVLFFVLGLLCAAFLALLIVPPIVRRAVSMTRKRMQASAPMTLAEIQADKDQMRARFAMATRRLEISVRTLERKVAEQLVEISRGRETLKTAAAEKTGRDELKTALDLRDEQLRSLTDRLAGAERTMKERAVEYDKLEQLYEEASFSSSNRQIELVGRESEVEKLAVTVSAQKDQRREAERRNQVLAAENKAMRDELKAERKKTAELDKKLERQLSILADRESRLDRKEKDRASLRDSLNAAAAAPAGIDKALEADRDRLEARLIVLARENKRLRAGAGASVSLEAGNDRGGDSLLRERMKDLAAQVVNLTATLDGQDSPIAKALAVPVSGQAGDGQVGNPSLADRVRALQRTAAPD